MGLLKIKKNQVILFQLFIVIIFTSLTISCKQHSAVSNKSEIEKKVADLVTQMTLEEKVGQMTQITLDIISDGEFEKVKQPHSIDTLKLAKAIINYKV